MKLVYNKSTKNFSSSDQTNYFAARTITAGEVVVYSLRKIMDCDLGKKYLSKLPKLGRLLMALKLALIDETKWPFIYSVNYKFPEEVLSDAKRSYGNGDSLEESYNSIKLHDYTDPKTFKANDLMLKTQGVLIHQFGKNMFDDKKLAEYGIPPLKGKVYIDLNPLTEKEKKIVDIPDYYSTSISYHSMMQDKSKIKVKLPYMIQL